MSVEERKILKVLDLDPESIGFGFFLICMSISFVLITYSEILFGPWYEGAEHSLGFPWAVVDVDNPIIVQLN